MTMKSPIDVEVESERSEGVSCNPDGERQIVGMAPTSFANTFQNPFFWVLIGVVGTLAMQYVMAGAAKKKE